MQTIQNLWFRIVAWIGQFFSFLARQISNLLRFLSNLFGLTASTSFIESEQEQNSGSTQTETPTSVSQYSRSGTSSNRRRPDASLDNFRKLARETKASS
ncbi:hypothetical protein [Oscillatoria salina]|uniref:hypothetical protein n=1 Tax=Oscillatoria salina TaxID=331517 RepID=UPI0013BAD2C8|nr:hypothetical protein [Oscillatoria salina]MBZ8180206.1 hypothetical protein [Oscillatoria salina IIICB1]NET91240.1 hypothetical protein [Kamptonema sp. SIO1D9]